jgi:hypothetical protein
MGNDQASSAFWPVVGAATAIVGTLIGCTAIIVRHVDGIAPVNNAVELYGIENRLESIKAYVCSADRTLQSIDYTLLPPAIRSREPLHTPERCPGDPGSPP